MVSRRYNEEMLTCGLVNKIQAPKLGKATQPELIRFKTIYETYQERVDDINIGRPSSKKIKAASIRQFIKPKLLHSLCILGYITGASKAEEDTDVAVKDWFNSRLAHTSRVLNNRVKEALSSGKYKPLPRYHAGAAEQFVLDVIAALDEHNASLAITETDRCKQLVTKLVHKVEPPELRQLVCDQMGMWTSEQKGSLTFFANTVSTLADQVQAVQAATLKLKRKHVNGQPKSSQESSNSELPKKLQKTSRSVHNRLDQKRNSSTQKTKGKKRNWDKPCLNEECEGIQTIRKCPITPKEMLNQLLDDFFGSKKMRDRSTKLAALRSTPTGIPNEEEGRYAILMNEVHAIGLGDSGANMSAIPISAFNGIRRKHPKTPFQQFEKPLVLELLVKVRGQTGVLTASGKTKLFLTIVLPNTVLPIRIRDVDFLISDEEMAEVLLGRPLLKAMGFDVAKHLQKVGGAIDGKSKEELKANTIRISSTSFKGLSYSNAKDEPVEPPSADKLDLEPTPKPLYSRSNG